MKLCVSTAAALLAVVSLSHVQGLALFNRGKKKNIGMPPLPEKGKPKAIGEISTTGTVSVKGDKDLADILKQNEQWIDEMKAEDPAFFDKLGSGHKPTYFWIGCADARVPANEIMGEPAGSVFVQRSVANMVVGTDNNLLSSLQYAVAYLKIPHIIVCGHYECGGVRASVTRFNHMPPLENWLRNIRDVYRVHRKELDAIKDPEERHRRLVELNVVEQCINLYKTGVVQRRRLETKNEPPYPVPQIHGVVFDPKVGLLKRVPVDFKKMSDDLDGIYDLYESYAESTADISPLKQGKMVLEVGEEWPTLAKEPVAKE